MANAKNAAAHLVILQVVTFASEILPAPLWSRLPAITTNVVYGESDTTLRMEEHRMRLSLWALIL